MMSAKSPVITRAELCIEAAGFFNAFKAGRDALARRPLLNLPAHFLSSTHLLSSTNIISRTLTQE